MPENTENYDLIDTAQEAVAPHELANGIWLTRNGYQVTDLRAQIEQGNGSPDRAKGSHTTTSVESFAAYLAKHGLPATELWGSRDTGTIRAVINAHEGAALGAGWGDHRVTLQLRHSDDWRDWTAGDGQLMPQAAFAEFIEDHLPNFVHPTAADMLELAQTFQATTKVDFASSQRVKSGETQLTYNEQQSASAGKKGQLAIPDTFHIGILVYDNLGDPYKIEARFRYRITGGTLQLGYRLTRPKDVLQAAFDGVVDEVEQATNRDVWHTT